MMEPWRLLAELDKNAALWVALHRTAAMTAIMRFFTEMGGTVGMTVLGLLVVGLLLWRRGRRPAFTVAAALAGSAVLNELLKALFDRARPAGDWLTHASGHSFPSGHSQSSMGFFLVLAFVLSSSGALRRIRPLVVAIGIALSLVIGFSRVYLGVHYASDVLAGWFFGAAWGVICLAAYCRSSAQ